MIKIISGTYGLRKNNRVIPKNSKSEPFEISPDEERRLVEIGVAKYVENQQTKAPDKSNDKENVKETDNTSNFEDMTVKQLKAYAEEHNIKLNKKANKPEIISAIQSAENSEIDDDAPDLKTQLPQ